jgi:hypothetical protein
MPEFHAILGDIYRLYKHDEKTAEEQYQAAVNVGFTPYLKESKGLMIANHGYGLILAEKAKAIKDTDAKKFNELGAKASFHLWAYLGWYGDEDAPDKGGVMALLNEIDPSILKRQADEKAREEKYKEQEAERKIEKKKVKSLMEY